MKKERRGRELAIEETESFERPKSQVDQRNEREQKMALTKRLVLLRKHRIIYRPTFSLGKVLQRVEDGHGHDEA